MRVELHPDAKAELRAATLWYDERRPGLGLDFLAAFEVAVGRIRAEPMRWRKVRAENRQVNFSRFPYAVIYSVAENSVQIKAVMHFRRRPFYWASRT